MGSLMQKTMNQSFYMLEEVLSLEVTARVMAQAINNSQKNSITKVVMNCSYFIDQVITNATIANQICLNYNFSDVE